MDTNKENELMQNLERQVGGGDAGHLPDGRPIKEGEGWLAVNPPGTSQDVSQQQALQAEMQQGRQTGGSKPARRRAHFFGQIAGQNTVSQADAAADIDKVTPEMVNRIEMYGAEAVYNAGEDR